MAPCVCIPAEVRQADKERSGLPGVRQTLFFLGAGGRNTEVRSGYTVDTRNECPPFLTRTADIKHASERSVRQTNPCCPGRRTQSMPQEEVSAKLTPAVPDGGHKTRRRGICRRASSARRFSLHPINRKLRGDIGLSAAFLCELALSINLYAIKQT